MTTERIGRLQSLLDRIKRNAAKPKQHLGQNLVLSGVQAARSDVAAGPSVPVIARTAHSDVAAPRPAIAPAAAFAPAVPAPVTDVARPQPQIVMPFGAPRPAHEHDEELEIDEADVIASSKPQPAPVANASEKAAFEFDEAATHHVKPSTSDPDIDNLSWSEPPVEASSVQEAPPPDSSRRARVASSIDEALVSATADSEPEIPIKTPPPESGRQPADGVYAAAMQGGMGDAAALPTVEQLGDTLELEEPTSAALELDLVQAEVRPEREELELEIPARSSVLEPPGTSVPPEVAGRDAPHRAPEHSQVVELPSDAQVAKHTQIERATADATLMSDASQLALQPELTARTATGQSVPIEVLKSARAFAPRSFVELLDASLKL